MDTAAPSAPDAPDRYSESDWLEAQKFAQVMKGVGASQAPALVLYVALAALLYGRVPMLPWALWLAFAGVVLAFRHVFWSYYRRRVVPQAVAAHVLFMHRFWWVWPVYAAIWALSSWLFVGRLSPEIDVVCWMMVAGIAAVGVSWMSAHGLITRWYLITYISLIWMGIALRIWTGGADGDPPLNVWLPLLLLAYWAVLLKVSAQLSDLYTKSIDLRYHNALLIESLKHQTQIAQDAVTFKDRFLAGAAHDLKQPVNALAIYAEWLASEPELSEELSPKILQATQAVNTLFDSLFDLVKLDAGRFGLELQWVDLGALLADLEVQLRPLARQKGLQLRVRPFEGHVMTDRVMLQRILANLVANAVRYTQQGGVLMGVRRPAEGGLRIEVWDTGIGLSADDHARVFGEFYKVHTAGTEGGFGLGLSIVSRLSASLGYPLTLRSRLGSGTVFGVTLPPEALIKRPAGRSSAQSEWPAYGS